jgi:RNA polymerase sigma factor (sigma-70 family)
MEHEINSLIAEYKRTGSDKAFNEFIQLLMPEIRRKISFLNDIYVIDDVLSEVLEKINEIKDKIEPDKNPYRFLMTVAKNQALDYYKKNKTLSTTSLSEFETEEWYENIPDENSSIEENYISNEHKTNVQRTIKNTLLKLNEYEQDVIIMSFFCEFPLIDISEIMNQSDGNIRSLKSRALGKMREHIPLKRLMFSSN